MKIISTFKDEIFASRVIPQLVINAINDTLYVTIRNKEHKAMKDYLEKEYEIDFEEIYESMTLDSFISTKTNGRYFIEINSFERVSNTNVNLKYILNFIDNGNLDVKGLHIVDKSMRYIQENLENIYQVYLKGGIQWQ